MSTLAFSYADLSSNILHAIACVLAAPWLIGRPRVLRCYHAVVLHFQLRGSSPEGAYHMLAEVLVLCAFVIAAFSALILPPPAALTWLIIGLGWFGVFVLPLMGTVMVLLHNLAVRKAGYLPTMAVLGAICFFLARFVAIIKAVGQWT